MIQKTGSIQELERAAFLASCLWPRHSPRELQAEWEAPLAQGEAALFLAVENGGPVGFAHYDLRHNSVAGTATSPVGYLESICVQQPFQGRGIGKALVRACESWALEKGCREFARDCEWENVQSLRFHLGGGLCEAERLNCFAKNLPGRQP